ncbi:MAG: hypothetical protein HQ522_05485 [Bacteroidetes bacterium]|nr:hypothetical protein [Bacteroidota bacterium]
MKLLFKALFILALSIWNLTPAVSQEPQRWGIENNGSIKWEVKENDSHMDHVEMSGLQISSIVHYGVEEGVLNQKIRLIFPMLRTIPNDTHGSLLYEIDNEMVPQIRIDGVAIEEKPSAFYHKGILSYQSKMPDGIEIKHQLFPSTDQPVFIDKVIIKNTSQKTVQVEIPNIEIVKITDKEKGVNGAYKITVVSSKSGIYKLDNKEIIEYSIIYSARVIYAEDRYVSVDYELKKREDLVENTFSDLVFESPSEVLNKTFDFAKLRAVESIYATKGGLMHGPGGGRYYAAIWANDQAEYANPFFPFLGNLEGNESAINSFRHFALFMNDDFKPIPSSIVAEGIDIWNGAGDRGDMAMIAYGASRFALSYGKKETARELWPLVEWCLEYCKRNLNSEGVVSSDCDELENRFPAGDANLNTSSLYYDALISAAFLGKELGVNQNQLDQYIAQSKEMKRSIEKHFGANVAGFETYRYYNGNEVLRAWICTPLTVDIFGRSEGTIDALFSKELWTEDGLASEAGKITFWDRATLYGLRGVFAAGETKRAMDFFLYYSKRRLLGEHVPYAVEAYPEGNQRHLSAESALYCRVITEGLWGIRPVGFSSFSLTPKLPEDWDSMALRKIKAFDQSFDIEVKREQGYLAVKVFHADKVFLTTKVKNGARINVEL